MERDPRREDMLRGTYTLIAVFSGIVAAVWLIPFFVTLATADEFQPLSLAFLVPFAVLAVIAVVFMKKALRQPRKADSRTDPIALGTLTHLEREGMFINEVRVYRLYLDVRTPEGHVFRGVLREAIPDAELARMIPGTRIPVVYDPAGQADLARPAAGRMVD